ncbi:hypothetical protein ACOTCG_30650, partial [Achromobacter xylosoxidans]
CFEAPAQLLVVETASSDLPRPVDCGDAEQDEKLESKDAASCKAWHYLQPAALGLISLLTFKFLEPAQATGQSYQARHEVMTNDKPHSIATR